jgi:hypothetical protein
MKLYKIQNGIIIESKDDFYITENVNWDDFINDDNLLEKITHPTLCCKFWSE